MDNAYGKQGSTTHTTPSTPSGQSSQSTQSNPSSQNRTNDSYSVSKSASQGSASNQANDQQGGDLQSMLKQGQEQAGQLVKALDKQVKDNPWPIIAGVAIGAFLLGTISGRSTK